MFCKHRTPRSSPRFLAGAEHDSGHTGFLPCLLAAGRCVLRIPAGRCRAAPLPPGLRPVPWAETRAYTRRTGPVGHANNSGDPKPEPVLGCLVVTRGTCLCERVPRGLGGRAVATRLTCLSVLACVPGRLHEPSEASGGRRGGCPVTCCLLLPAEACPQSHHPTFLRVLLAEAHGTTSDVR